MEIDEKAELCVKCGANPSKKPIGKDPKFCINCGEKIDLNAEICVKCGVRQKGGQGQQDKSPGMAAVLSLIFSAFGYLYLGCWKRGLVVMVITIIAAILTASIGGFVVDIIAAYDVYKLAKKEPAPFDFLNEWAWIEGE